MPALAGMHRIKVNSAHRGTAWMATLLSTTFAHPFHPSPPRPTFRLSSSYETTVSHLCVAAMSIGDLTQYS
jgi:hypothetical protein